MKANEKAAQSANANNNVNNESNVTDNVQATATDATATDEKAAQEKEAQRKKAIAAKVAEIKKTTKEIHEKRDVTDFLDTSDKGIAAATATKFQTLGKFHGKFQAIEAKDGGKTVYIFESEKDIYIGFTSSELSDIFKLEKRQYKKSDSDNNESAVLRALKDFRNTLAGVQHFGFFGEIKIEKVDAAITEQEANDTLKIDFEKRFAANIPLFSHITEAVFLGLPNVTQSDLDTALKLGYKFSDTKESDKESE